MAQREWRKKIRAIGAFFLRRTGGSGVFGRFLRKRPTGAIFGRRAAARIGSGDTPPAPSNRTPRAESIRGRFSTYVVLFCNVRFAHTHGFTPVARLSVTTFAPRTPLPPSISLRTSRTFSAPPQLRVRFLRRLIPSFWFAFGELRNSARYARYITAFH